MKNKLKKFSPMILAIILLFVMFIAVLSHGAPSAGGWVLWAYVVCIFIAYFATLYTLSKHLDEVPITHLTLAVVNFGLVGVIVLGLFAIAFSEAKLFSCSFNLVEKHSIMDALYFSTISFTTVGFGDCTPSGLQGRFLAMAEAMFGVTHMAAFLTFTIIRLKSK